MKEETKRLISLAFMVSCGTDELDVRGWDEQPPLAALEREESEETVEPPPESVFDLNECIFTDPELTFICEHESYNNELFTLCPIRCLQNDTNVILREVLGRINSGDQDNVEWRLAANILARINCWLYDPFTLPEGSDLPRRGALKYCWQTAKGYR